MSYQCAKQRGPCDIVMRPGIREGTYSGSCCYNTFSIYASDAESAVKQVVALCCHGIVDIQEEFEA